MVLDVLCSETRYPMILRPSSKEFCGNGSSMYLNTRLQEISLYAVDQNEAVFLEFSEDIKIGILSFFFFVLFFRDNFFIFDFWSTCLAKKLYKKTPVNFSLGMLIKIKGKRLSQNKKKNIAEKKKKKKKR